MPSGFTTEMPYAAVLDACVLHALPLADTLLRLAEEGFYRPALSEAILDEVDRSLARRGYPPERLAARRSTITEVFREAIHAVPDTFPEAIPAAVHEKDRHVVAVALAARTEAIVTANVRHFAPEALAALGVAVQTPDEFLVHQLWLDPDCVLAVLSEQAAALVRPPMSLDELLARLHVRVPEFARQAAEQRKRRSSGWTAPG